MAQSRFYCSHPLQSGDHFALPEELARHAVRVLRLGVGDSLTLFDGLGGEYQAQIGSISSGQVRVKVHGHVDREVESSLNIWLGQALCATEKMDWILQKAVELGVNRCTPLNARRSVVKLTAERGQKREQHWLRVVQSACEQSGRNRVPPVDSVWDAERWNAALPEGAMKLFLSPDGNVSLAGLVKPSGPVAIMVGPEGGWSPEECRWAEKAGFHSIRLGPRVLRTETAALALVSALQARWGDFSGEGGVEPL